LPVVATALQVHVKLLREDPPVARMRVTPAIAFGAFQPYEVVAFEELTQDLLMDTESFLDLPLKLSSHDFYKRFLRTRTEPSSTNTPVGLLLSMDVAPVGSE
jgi:hypothetical protein